MLATKKQRLMKSLGLKASSLKDKYKSYRCICGKIYSNLLLDKDDGEKHTVKYDCNFSTTTSNQKWATGIA